MCLHYGEALHQGRFGGRGGSRRGGIGPRAIDQNPAMPCPSGACAEAVAIGAGAASTQPQRSAAALVRPENSRSLGQIVVMKPVNGR